jgi:hypothetical protein
MLESTICRHMPQLGPAPWGSAKHVTQNRCPHGGGPSTSVPVGRQPLALGAPRHLAVTAGCRKRRSQVHEVSHDVAELGLDASRPGPSTAARGTFHETPDLPPTAFDRAPINASASARGPLGGVWTISPGVVIAGRVALVPVVTPTRGSSAARTHLQRASVSTTGAGTSAPPDRNRRRTPTTSPARIIATASTLTRTRRVRNTASPRLPYRVCHAAAVSRSPWGNRQPTQAVHCPGPVTFIVAM